MQSALKEAKEKFNIKSIELYDVGEGPGRDSAMKVMLDHFTPKEWIKLESGRNIEQYFSRNASQEALEQNNNLML